MLSRRDEIDAFKRIDLSQYAASCGYELDRKRSSRTSLAMAGPGGDKIVVAREGDGHWIYFSVRDHRDNGTIVDFVQNRRRLSLGEVRKELRPWLAGGPSPAPPSFRAPVLEAAAKDSVAVRARLEAMTPISAHRYLEEARAIPREVLGHPRFAGRIFADDRANAVFPHQDSSGICGYEIKNRDFTGFSPGGRKGLWTSRCSEGDDALVVAESALDALSHFASKRPVRSRYVSTAGSLNRAQPELLVRAAEHLPENSAVVVAVDNDEAGDRLKDQLREMLGALRPRVSILEDRPARRGTDWNDFLKIRREHGP